MRKSRSIQFSCVCILTLATVLISCRKEPSASHDRAVSKRHVFDVRMQADRTPGFGYSGTGRYYLMSWGRAEDKDDAPFWFTLDGMHLPPGVWYTERTTQYNDAHVTGSLQPLETNWDFFACDAQVDSQVPLDILFAGFYSTNSSNTNDEGTFFTLPPGKTNVSFGGKLVHVFRKPKPRNAR
jgi:hypothetical protein